MGAQKYLPRGISKASLWIRERGRRDYLNIPYVTAGTGGETDLEERKGNVRVQDLTLYTLVTVW